MPSLSSAGRTTPPVAVLPGTEVTVTAVATVEPAEREQHHKVWALQHIIAVTVSIQAQQGTFSLFIL